MSKNVSHIQHVKSSVVENGQPKLPTASVIVEGEIAVNYADGFETLSIKTSSGNIATFSSDNYYTEKKLGSGFTGENSANTVTSVIEDNERAISAALNDLEANKLDVSAYTPTDLSNYYTKSETSGKTELSDAFDEKADITWVEDKLGSAFTGDNSANTVTSVIEENEEIVSTALNDLDTKKLDVSAYTPTDLSNYYTKSETSGKTEISTELNKYADSVKYNSTSHTIEFYHGTTAGTKVFEVDASAFIIDGMVDDVEVADIESGSTTVKCLVVTFNTDAGKQDINIPLSDIFDPNLYYTKDEIDDSELVISSALNDLETNKLDVSAYTPTDLSNYYTKSETSGATELSDAFDEKADIDWVEDKLGSGFTGENSANTVTSVIEENEEIVSTALNDLETKKLDVSAYTPTDLSNYYTKSETSGATEISNALGAKVNSQTFISHTADTNVHVTSEEKESWDEKADESWVEDKLGSGFTGENSANTVTSVIRDNELIISAALNDLETNKLDVSAYTPTDLSNYYTKSQTSSATEISDAFIEAEEQIEREHTTIAAALNDLNDRISSAASESDLDEIVDALNDLIDNVKDKSKTVSAALNDLEDNKLDVSAYTPTDLSNYYTKSETSGATELSDAFDEKADVTWINEKLGSGFTGANSGVTVTEAIENIVVDQVIDSGTSASTNAVSTHAVYQTITDNELVWTNAYVALSGIISSHTEDVSIHRIDIVTSVSVDSDLTNVTCPYEITGTSKSTAQALVIYDNSSTTTDYNISVLPTYKTPSGSQITLTCPKNGYCKIKYININGTIYASEA